MTCMWRERNVMMKKNARLKSLIGASGGGLVPLFRNMLKNRGGSEYPVTEFRDYGVGGVGGIIRGEAVLLGSLDFLQSMDVDIPQGTTVAQAVYMAINGELSAVVQGYNRPSMFLA